MSIGFVYAGQGSQHVGMGQDFYDKYELFRSTIDKASEYVSKVTPMDISKLAFEGSDEELANTRFTQPVMVAFAIGITKLLHEAGLRPEYSCGLSLGEYSALFEAGVFDEKTALNLVAKRGKAMDEASSGMNVKMCAVLGADRELVLECTQAATERFAGEKIVQAANFNCPGQIVISGHSEAVDVAAALLKDAGVKRILPLKVSGPFHTSLMKKAGDVLEEELAKIDLGKMNSKVIFNCTGKEQDDKEIKDLLVKQVQSSVFLEDSIKYMEDHGVDTIIEIGPGNAISKFIKKTSPDMRVFSIDKVEDFEKIKEELVVWA